MNTKNLHKHTSQAGFTLVELIVAIAIMVLVTALIVVNYRKFDGNIVLKNLAYDMGLSIRKAQTYGISVQGAVSGTNQTFIYPYGIEFKNATPQAYTLFIDLNTNNIYDAGELVESFTLRSPFQIQNLCRVNSSNVETCGLTQVDVTFARPNPDATVKINGTTVVTDAVKIVIGTSQDTTATSSIVVRSTGQISIQ